MFRSAGDGHPDGLANSSGVVGRHYMRHREYFHGDNGAAIGAFHQTGWTGLIADVILRRHGAVRSVGDVVREVSNQAQLCKEGRR